LASSRVKYLFLSRFLELDQKLDQKKIDRGGFVKIVID